MARVTNKEFEQTISNELFSGWKQFRRKGDPEKLATILGKSKPVIDRALKYGHVKDQVVVKGITEFYMARKIEESNDGKQLLK